MNANLVVAVVVVGILMLLLLLMVVVVPLLFLAFTFAAVVAFFAFSACSQANIAAFRLAANCFDAEYAMPPNNFTMPQKVFATEPQPPFVVVVPFASAFMAEAALVTVRSKQ